MAMTTMETAAAPAMDVDDDVEDTPLSKLETMEVVDKEAALKGYLELVGKEVEKGDTKAMREKEVAIVKVGEHYAETSSTADLAALIKSSRAFLTQLSKAKGGQLLKQLLDHFLSIKGASEEQVKAITESIEWAKAEKRTFLRQALEVRLVQLHLDARQYKLCIGHCQPLVSELKRLDDKALLVEVQLVESQAYYALSNYPKSRAALVSARGTANAIYCPPKMQAGLDLQSGILHAQETDYKTAYSYFYEAFEGADSINDERAILGLKYMLLMKIIMKESDDVPSIISGKLALKYAGLELQAMEAVSKASLNRSLEEFETALGNFTENLEGDVIISTHLKEMYDTLLTQNLARIVEPYSRVELDFVALTIKRSREIVEHKLSQMILDNQLTGIIDQGAGCLEIFDDVDADQTYEAALETVKHTEQVVHALYKKSRKLF